MSNVIKRERENAYLIDNMRNKNNELNDEDLHDLILDFEESTLDNRYSYIMTDDDLIPQDEENKKQMIEDAIYRYEKYLHYINFDIYGFGYLIDKMNNFIKKSDIRNIEKSYILMKRLDYMIVLAIEEIAHENKIKRQKN